MAAWKKGFFAVLILLFSAAVLSACLLYRYAYSAVLPDGLRIAGWQVGGMSYTHFQQQWTANKRKLEARQLEFRTDEPGWTAETATLGELGFRVDEQPLKREIDPLFRGNIVERVQQRRKLRNREIALTLIHDESMLENALGHRWKTGDQLKPLNAARLIDADDQVVYTSGKTVVRVDRKRLAARIGNAVRKSPLTLSPALEALVVELPLVTVQPRITAQSLESEGISRKISEFSTSFAASASGRKHNIRSTALSIRDLILKPGEIFSFDKIVRETGSRFGFQAAPVIRNGVLTQGVGGGICQVSTTLYNAAVRGGLAIVERRNHSLPVSYVPLGQDATYAGGYINFRFRNTTGKHLLIRTETRGDKLTVKLFGTMPEGVSYRLASKVVRLIQPQETITDNPLLAPGERKVIREGKPGYVVVTYREKWVNDRLAKRQRISSDTYLAQPTLVAMNSGLRIAPPEPVPSAPDAPPLEDGVNGGGTRE